jgi:DNA-binding NarL/FixJ family response regulator
LPDRILIVDDSHIARKSIKVLLHSFQICGEAQDGKEAIEKVLELKPDLVLLDITMPVMDGIKAAEEIRRIAPATKIVFLTLYDTSPVRERTRMWADGFVAKNVAADELIPLLKRLCTIDGQPKPTSGAIKPRHKHARPHR